MRQCQIAHIAAFAVPGRQYTSPMLIGCLQDRWRSAQYVEPPDLQLEIVVAGKTQLYQHVGAELPLLLKGLAQILPSGERRAAAPGEDGLRCGVEHSAHDSIW